MAVSTARAYLAPPSILDQSEQVDQPRSVSAPIWAAEAAVPLPSLRQRDVGPDWRVLAVYYSSSYRS